MAYQMIHNPRSIPSTVTGKDKFVSLSQAKTAFLQLPLHLPQDNALLRPRQTLHLSDTVITLYGVKQ